MVEPALMHDCVGIDVKMLLPAGAYQRSHVRSVEAYPAPLIETDTPTVIPVFGLRVNVGASTVNELLAESPGAPAAVNVIVPELGGGNTTLRSATAKVPEVPE